MGFLKKIGGALSKLPGAKTLNKPINRALGNTPGLKGVPGKLGMAPKPTATAKPASPIAPNPGVVNKATTAAPTMGAPIARAPMPMQRQPPPMMQPPPPAPIPPPVEPQMMAPPPMQPMEQAPPQMTNPIQPQFDPNQFAQLKQRMMGGNTGVTGGMMKGGIGPRWG